MIDPKKKIERHYLDRFLAVLADAPAGEIVETEVPDFLVASGKRTIGIELTELHCQAVEGTVPSQATQAMRQRVVARAQEIWEIESGHPVQCAAHLQPGHIGRAKVEPLAQAIVEIVRSKLPGPNSSIRVALDWLEPSALPEGVHSLSIYRSSFLSRSHFFCLEATWVGPLTVADIARAMEPKEGRITAYRTRCDEAWLLIASDLFSPSTWFQFDQIMELPAVGSHFDRAFIFRLFGSKIHELQLCRA